jgi:hypothetical protein
MLHEEAVADAAADPTGGGLAGSVPGEVARPSTTSSKLDGVRVTTSKPNPFTLSAEPAQTSETVLNTNRLAALQSRRRLCCRAPAAASWPLRSAMTLALATMSSAAWVQAMTAFCTIEAPAQRGLLAIESAVVWATLTLAASVPVALRSTGSARSTGFALLFLGMGSSSFPPPILARRGRGVRAGGRFFILLVRAGEEAGGAVE